MPNEVDIRKRLVALWDSVPALSGYVTDWGRMAVDDHSAAARARRPDGSIQGGIVRLKTPPRDVPYGLGRVKRSFHYEFTALCDVRETWSAVESPLRSSEDFYIAEMIEPLYEVIRNNPSLGFPQEADSTSVRVGDEAYCYGVRDLIYPRDDLFGAFHLSSVALDVAVYVPAEACPDSF